MAKEGLRFLASVSRHCRKITELATAAIADEENYQQEAARRSLKDALTAHLSNLTDILPASFPVSRRHDLARHIGFCQPGDWLDIVRMDVPDILAKAEAFALEMEEEGDMSALDQFIHPAFRPKVELALQAQVPNYHDLIVVCSTALSTLFTRKSGANDDGEGEIGRVFSPNAPVLLVPVDLSTETNRNRQRGALLLLQGFRAFIRNPHSHGVQPADKEYAVHSLMLMSFIARIIDGATRQPPAP